MDATNVRLSPTEMELVASTDFILTKNSILRKTMELLGRLHASYQDQLQTGNWNLPAAISGSTAKISRGENYKGLPWLVLDYPRLFKPSATFAIRTLFWWGNFFSITLQLSGEHKQSFEPKIAAAYYLLKEKGFFINVNPDPWEHHFEIDNYRPLDELREEAFTRILGESSFIKLANRVPLRQWEEAQVMLNDWFRVLLSVLDS